MEGGVKKETLEEMGWERLGRQVCGDWEYVEQVARRPELAQCFDIETSDRRK